MTSKRRLAAPSLAAIGLAASLGFAVAGGAEPDRGAGTSGRGDGSGMGQDNSEIGTPKGPGDKPAAAPPAPAEAGAKEQRLEGTSSEGPGMIGRCDDGRAPVNGACAR